MLLLYVSKSCAKCHGSSRLVKGDPPIGRLWLLITGLTAGKKSDSTALYVINRKFLPIIFQDPI